MEKRETRTFKGVRTGFKRQQMAGKQANRF